MTTNLYRVLPVALKGRLRLPLAATSSFHQHWVRKSTIEDIRMNERIDAVLDYTIKPS